MLERQRPEQDGIDDGEHPDHRPDGKSESSDRGDEKARRADERPPGVTEVQNPLHDHVGAPHRGLADSTETGLQKFAVAVRKYRGITGWGGTSIGSGGSTLKGLADALRGSARRAIDETRLIRTTSSHCGYSCPEF